MVTALLDSELRVSRGRRTSVARARLRTLLKGAFEARLTLVSVPAGFGKTTLVAQWLSDPITGLHGSAWLSLDQRDNDPVVFWTYVLASLRTVSPSMGEGALALLHSQPTPMEEVLVSLLNDISKSPHDVVLCLTTITSSTSEPSTSRSPSC